MRVPRQQLRSIIFIAVVFSIVACIERSAPTQPGSLSPSDSPSTTDVNSVVVRLPVTSLEVGQVATAAASPLNAAGQPVESASIEWSSSDTAILTVTAEGLVTARKMGAASVWATSHGISGRGSLGVTDSLPAKVVISPGSAKAAVDATVQLSAVVTTRTGRSLPGHVVAWTSTDPRYAVVSATGVVTGKLKGSAKIVAAASPVADTQVVDISPAPIARLSVTPPAAALGSGSTMQLTAHAEDAEGNALTGRNVGWMSSDASVASISTSGVVTAARFGDAAITASAEGVKASSVIHVSAGAVSSVTVTPGSIGLVSGATQQLAVVLNDAAGNVLPAQAVKWSVSDNNVAIISPTGMVTAHHEGSATITADVNGVAGKASVVVSAGAVKSVSVSPASLSLATGGTRQLAAVLTDAAGNTINNGAVAWSISSSAIASVSSTGLVSAKHSGNAVITAAAGGATDTVPLTVTPGGVASVSISPASSSLVAGETQQLVATLNDNTGSVITGKTITWKSSDETILSVSSTGVARGAHVGNATVTASADGISGQALFAVTAGPVNSVSLTPASGSVQAGKTIQLSATFADVAGNPVPGGTISWASSNSAVATVGGSGLVTGAGAGVTNVTATANGKSRSAAITVTAAVQSGPTLTRLTIAPANVTLSSGATVQFEVSATWSNGSTTVPAVTYSATGGTITGSGLYTAGTSTGAFRVIATQQGGTEADTSVVSVTRPVAQAPGSCVRSINVSTLSTLTSALSVAVPGDCILVAPGTYTLGGKLVVGNSGTPSAPIIVQGSGSNTVIDVNQMSMYVDGSYVQLRKLRLTNFNTIGLWLRGVTGVVLDSLEVDHTLQEAVKFMGGSNHNVLKNSLVHDTGILHPQWGEGVYVGGKNNDGSFDLATYNEVLNNHFGPNVRAEEVDVKEGADHTTIRGNFFDGTGMVYINYATVSVVAIVGNYATIDANYIQVGNPEGVSFIKGVGTMVGNVATRNTMDLQPNRTGMPWASAYAPDAIAGFQFQSPELYSGATVSCDNVMISGRLSTKVPICTP
jgi:trimeric autotransporter adhesin